MATLLEKAETIYRPVHLAHRTIRCGCPQVLVGFSSGSTFSG